MPAQTDFIVNSSPLGVTYSPFAPAVATLPDGRALILWVSSDTGDQLQADIRGRWIGADGLPEGDDFVVNTTTTDFQWRPVATVTTDGRVFVAWESGDGGDGDGITVRGRVIDPDDPGAGTDFILNSPASAEADPDLGGNQSQPALTALPDGRVFALWTSYDGSDGDGLAIRGRFFDADGAALGDDFLVNSTGVSGQLSPRAEVLADGRIFVTYASGDGGGDVWPGTIRGRVLDDAGPVGDDFVLNTTTDGYQASPDVAALAGGGAVVVWFTSGPEIPQGGGNPGFGPAEIRGRVIGADGQPVGADFAVNDTPLEFNYAYPKVAALPDRRVFVVWHSGDGGDGDWGTLRGRVLGADGQPVAADFVINSTGMNNQSSPVLDVRADGQVLISWSSDDGGALGAQTRACVVNLVLGDGGAETLAGAAGQDVIMGFGGQDMLRGAAGLDQVMGGLGRDMLFGGRGSDVLAGGSGADVLRGGAGADMFVFAAADRGAGDTITDFGRGDVIDLSGLDANAGLRGDQAFTFVGGAAFSAAGQLRYAGGSLWAEMDGDGRADLRIVVQGNVGVDDLIL